MEGVHGSNGDCWKGLGVGKSLKCFWNWEAVGVRRMLRVSEVGVEKIPRHLQSRKEVVP